MTDFLNAELHCHNVYSNCKNQSYRMPFDSGVSIEQLLDSALKEKINVLFVTNHDTLKGYNEILDYQQNHRKYYNIKIYPAEEITIDNRGHVLAYGINKTVKPGMTLGETLDEIKLQNGVSCAAHPFAVSNGIRGKANMCDLMESFNSNNIDIFSNIIAKEFAEINKMFTIAGSDSHISSTMGRCINTIESENNLDSIIDNLRNGRSMILITNYATKKEIYEHLYYILTSSSESLLNYVSEYHPLAYHVVKWALASFSSNPNSAFWNTLGSLALYLARRVSKKVNIGGSSPEIFQNRSWKRLLSLAIVP
ncbi:MAG: PHP-associated domain-containing protein [Candidatus Nitrosopolaris sp.]